MGAIQGAVNNVLGTAAVAATAVKHIGEQEQAKTDKAINDMVELGESGPKLKAESEGLTNELKRIGKENEALADLAKNPEAIKSPEDKKALNELGQSLDKDREMAETALKTLEYKIMAKTELFNRAKKQLLKAGLVELAGKEKGGNK